MQWQDPTAKQCMSCESLGRIPQNLGGSKTTQPRMQWTDLIRPAMTQKDGDPNKIDYTRVGFETLHLFLAWPNNNVS